MKNDLLAISPLDGRYKNQTAELSGFVSEYALIKYRAGIEIKYLLTLSDKKIIRTFSKKEKEYLLSLASNFSIEEAEKVKEIEKDKINDVKSLETYLREKLSKTSLKDVIEYIHFGLTSDDINNIAYRLMLADSVSKTVLPALEKINKELGTFVKKHKGTVILARTHGQPAIPTTFGKEFAVFKVRLEKEIGNLKKQKLTGKLNGAIGNFNALYFAYPETDWVRFSKEFVSSFGLTPNLVTTQINPFEDVIALFQNLQRINGILLDFNQDTWRYISDGWLKYRVTEKEIGSSTMPQKLNPINFENSEGNLALANGFMQTMIDKLYVSRLQRDLSNSTIIRNLGLVLGYCLLAYKNAFSGLTKIDVNLEKIDKDLNEDWSILAEGLQIYLRKEGFHDAYSHVAQYTKGKKLNKEVWQKLITGLPVSEKEKKELLKLTPSTYLGITITENN